MYPRLPTTGLPTAGCSEGPGVYHENADGGMPGSEITIAERLKAGGYATAHVGKWHLGHTKGHLPTDQGFDQYFGVPYSNDMTVDPEMPVAEEVNFRKGMTLDKMRDPDNKKHDWVPLMKNEKVIEYPTNQATLTRRYTDKCQNFIREQADSDQPFFLYMAHTFPHIPLRSAEPWKGKSRRGLYGDVVEEIDHSVGQFLKTLRERGVAEDTLVVFTSDNGPWLTEGKRGGTSGLLRGGKGSTFEGGMREPTIFWWPNHLDKGVVRGLGSTLDLMPTFCDLAGIDPPSDRKLDGQSLKPALLGTGPSPRKKMFITTAATTSSRYATGLTSCTLSYRVASALRRRSTRPIRPGFTTWATIRVRSSMSPTSTRAWSKSCKKSPSSTASR